MAKRKLDNGTHKVVAKANVVALHNKSTHDCIVFSLQDKAQVEKFIDVIFNRD